MWEFMSEFLSAFNEVSQPNIKLGSGRSECIRYFPKCIVECFSNEQEDLPRVGTIKKRWAGVKVLNLYT